MKINIKNIDCLQGIKSLPDNSVDCICADPPYFLGLTSNGKKGNLSDLNIAKPFYTELFRQFNRVMKDNATLYWFCDWRGYAFYYPLLAEHVPVKNLIVWNKLSGPGNCYTHNHEFIIYGCKGNKNQGGSAVWDIKGFTHPQTRKEEGKQLIRVQKPLEVIRKILEDGAPRGGACA